MGGLMSWDSSSRKPIYPRHAWVFWASPNTPHAVAAGDSVVGLKKLVIFSQFVLPGDPKVAVLHVSRLIVSAPEGGRSQPFSQHRPRSAETSQSPGVCPQMCDSCNLPQGGDTAAN